MALPTGITLGGSPDADSPLVKHVRRSLVRFLVGKVVFCPNTGEALDADTCVVLVDSDGDPAAVLSQKGWASVTEDRRTLLAEKHGLTVDESTVKA